MSRLEVRAEGSMGWNPVDLGVHSVRVEDMMRRGLKMTPIRRMQMVDVRSISVPFRGMRAIRY